MNSPEKKAEHFIELVDLMARLRSEDGCPWDRKQTHESLKRYLVEECAELLDSIDSGDQQAVCEELGDMFLQLVFHAQIAAEAGQFDVGDALKSISSKLVFRHPHVFGDESAADAEEVLDIWQRQKEREGKGDEDGSALSRVPKSLPALARAQEIQRKASKVGFDWQEVSGPLEKVKEEVGELEETVTSDMNKDERENEIGDLLFAIVNVCRFLGIEAEDALRRANRKFEQRFKEVEERSRSQGRKLEEMSLEEMDALWDAVKEDEVPGKDIKPLQESRGRKED